MGSYSLAMETPSTERIRELSERLDSLRGELVSERTKAKESAPPAVVPAAAPVRNPVVLVGEPMPPPHVLATSSASQQQIDLLSNQLASLRSELSSSKPPAMGMPASYSAAYAANAPPAAVPTQAGLVAPEDFHSPTKTHVHNVHDTLCRVQDAFTNERRINDEVEIDRDNRERERSEEARREKFQRDALKIRETLDDDRQNRIEAAATLSHAAEDQFADLQYSTDNERQDLKDLDTRLTTEIQSRLTAIELELQQEVEDRTYVQDKREDLVKEGLQL